MKFKTRAKVALNVLFGNNEPLKRMVQIEEDKNKISQPENNCPCYDKYGNQIGFWSRSMAITLCAFLFDDGKWYILASQRGQGTPDSEYRGKWNVITGYLDTNETLGGLNDMNSDSLTCYDNSKIPNACQRECKEETGVTIDSTIKFWGYNDNPKKDKRQNVTFRFYTVLKGRKEFYESQFSHSGNEENEVEEIKFIPVEFVNMYEWAFDQGELIKSCFKKLWKSYLEN